ncbi:MAG: ATP-binding cassette domain-containing protein [Actinobacteria bacterium]|jgi:ABC-type nitrate/sulfonate/bicarbonate transport system ATPase subunit|nr:ATP-binding cassette domain-containing protein [Actinomycetota bacterium]
MGTLAIRLTGAARVFSTGNGRVPAFSGLDLEVRRGEVHALLGPSGCGKSTLLRILAGLDHLSAGELTLPRHSDGRPAAGIVLQDAHLLPWLTVADNVALGLRYRANRAVAAGRVDELLEVLGLAELADALPAELSGGQAQRVAIARTMLVAPPLLLLDEPFAALDPLTRRDLQDWLLRVRDLLDLTIVLVTHDVDEAIHLGDRVTLLRGGSRGTVGTWDTREVDRNSEVLAATRHDLLARYAATSDEPSTVVPGPPLGTNGGGRLAPVAAR